MRKTMKLFISVLILLAVLIPGTALCAFASNQSQVFNYLTQSLGFNSAASCGIMANIEHESEFKPNLVIRDANGLPSGGLCQWNGGRFTNLRNFCNNRGYDYLSIEGQLEYLKYELQKDSFKHIYKYLKSVPNSKEGAYNAAYYWCYYFEIPRDRANKAAARGNAAASKYWPVFSFRPIGAVTLKSAANGKTLDLDDVATVKWSAADGSVSGYRVLLAEKVKNAFDWDNAKTCTVSASTRGIDFDLNDLAPGRYAVRVVGVDNVHGQIGKCENTIKFAVDCLTHEFSLRKEVLPTFEKDGKRVYKCDQCGEKNTVSLEQLTRSGYAKRKVQSFSADETAATRVKLEWTAVSVAEGYRIWQKVEDEWVKIKTLSADTRTSNVVGLEPNKSYDFKIASYVKDGDETVFSAPRELTVTTRPEPTTLTEATGKSNGRISLKWERVKGVDGYIVYVSDDPAGEMTELAVCSNWWPFITLREQDEDARRFFTVCSFVETDDGRIISEPSNQRHATAK